MKNLRIKVLVLTGIAAMIPVMFMLFVCFGAFGILLTCPLLCGKFSTSPMQMADHQCKYYFEIRDGDKSGAWFSRQRIDAVYPGLICISFVR